MPRRSSVSDIFRPLVWIQSRNTPHAVATANGFTYRANHDTIYVTREGAAQEIPLTVTAATWIGPGDTVRVGERIF